MNAAQPDAYGVIRQLVIDNAGGYLRNVVWSQATCSHCAGVPGNAGFSTCYRCDGYIARAGQLSDRRGFITYALAGAQSGANMYRYKDQVPPPAATRMMTLLLAATLTKHLPVRREAPVLPSGGERPPMPRCRSSGAKLSPAMSMGPP